MKHPMNADSSHSSSSSKPHRTQFDHEKLEVYQLELRFLAWATDLLEEIKAERKSSLSEVCDQFDHASLSVLLNTAEGNGKRRLRVRAKFFDDARGSATECAACLDALVAKKACSGDRVYEGKTILLRVVSILSKLVDRFDGSELLREDAVDYRAGGQQEVARVEDEEEEEDDERGTREQS
jgi:four helix bundle protein